MSEYIKGIRRFLTEEEIKNVIAKYKVGDKVIFLDNNKEKKCGTIKEVEWTDINDWSCKLNPLYLIDGCQYLRSQNDILEICVEIAPKYREKERVYYIDIDGVEKVGKIQKIYETYVSDWNNVIKPLYIVGSCLYLRDEKDITGVYKSEIEDCIEDYA